MCWGWEVWKELKRLNNIFFNKKSECLCQISLESVCAKCDIEQHPF